MEGFECQAKEPVCDSITDEKPEKVLNGSDTATKLALCCRQEIKED